MVRAIDFYVLLKVAAKGDREWRQHGLAEELRISSQSVNAALSRGADARLYAPATRRVIGRHLREALTAIRYFLPIRMEGLATGVPTAWMARPFGDPDSPGFGRPTESTPVWPSSAGTTQGLSAEPLHPMAPLAALEDERFYGYLAAIDMIRLGSARERESAQSELRRALEVA